MESIRKLGPQEERLLEQLIKNASVRIPDNWKTDLLVRPMADGGMGSLTLFPSGIINEQRKFGQRVSELEFIDEDEIKVIVSLNVDGEGNLFELDIWKTDFNSLKKIPDKFD
jgi:hypothetical protein